MSAGIIHKSIFERIILSEYAVADLTTASANVFYELGVRHAVRPWSTILLYAEGSGQLPYDVAHLRTITYRLDPKGRLANHETTKAELLKRLKEAQHYSTIDSPIYQLVEGFPEIAHIKSEIFRDRLRDRTSHSSKLKEQIAAARSHGKESLLNLEKQLGDITNLESEIALDLFLSYRTVEGWTDMVNLAYKMDSDLAKSVMVQEQVALALNRAGDRMKAERVLLDLLKERGPSSETYGILGRVYKDRWETAYDEGDQFLAAGLLNEAIGAYMHGFEADWRDPYPGINAIVLMEIKSTPDPRRIKLLPVVEYAADRRIATGKPDYWDYATVLELAVLAKDEQKSTICLQNALVLLSVSWEAETTLRNLKLIRKAREARNELIPWATNIEIVLEKRASSHLFH